MPSVIRQKVVEQVVSYAGGQNSADEPDKIGADQVSLLENGLINNDGTQIKQRLGLTTFASVSSPTDARVYAIGILDFGPTNRLFKMYSNGTNHVLARLDDTLDGWTDVDSGFTKEKDSEMFQHFNKMVILNGGSDNVHVIDTSNSVTDLGTSTGEPPKGVAGTSHGGRVWVTDTNGDLYFSKLFPAFTAGGGGGDDWNQTDDVFQPLSKCIQPLSFKKNELIVYGQNTIEVVNTAGDRNQWRTEILNKNVGLVARRTAQNISNDQVFLSQDGFRLLSRTQFDTVRSGVISRNIQDVIDDINFAAVDKSWAIVVNNLYISGVPTGTATVPDRICILDLFQFLKKGKPAWATIKKGDWNLYSANVYRVSGVDLGVGGSADSSGDRDIFKMLNGATDDGTAITLRIEGREHIFGSNDDDKIFSHIFISANTEGSTTNLMTQYELDRRGFTTTDPTGLDLGTDNVYPSSTLFPSSSLFPKGSNKSSDNLWIKDRGKSIRPQFMHSTSGITPTVHGYKIYAMKRNVKGG